MSETRKNQKFGRHLWVIYSLSLILLGWVWFYQWYFGLIMTCLIIASFYYSLRSEKILFAEREEYISALSSRIEKVGEVALRRIPVGIVLFNEDYEIEWVNPFMDKIADEDSLLGNPLHVLSEHLSAKIKKEHDEIWFSTKGYKFQSIVRYDERILYLFDRTRQVETEQRYYSEQAILGIICLDNYEEITQNMDDTMRSKLNSHVTSNLNHWSSEYGIYLKRISQDRFLAFFTKETLQQLEEKKFDILDTVRDLVIEEGQRNSITLSIGIGEGSIDLPTLGKMAQSSLDLALGRGGDQVVIKDEAGEVRFFGGQTNPMEKRVRVRARVISHALTDLINETDHVMIMGHKQPDMDSLGAAIGVLAIARANGIDASIVLDSEDINPGIHQIIDALRGERDLWKYFIEREEAEETLTSRSLIVVVDTHKPSMITNAHLLERTDYKVIIDHHRRGEDFIENPTLVYMEPYASSTSELVTELIEYQPQQIQLNTLEATSLLAGIIVDTKSFALRTGSRTFDAASYLRSKGADTVLVQKFMKEDLQTYLKRSELIKRTELMQGTFAISAAEEGEVFDQVTIAQAADTLLTMNSIIASFVICERKDGQIGISARSLGDINVQIIMEKMGGGGHLTNAATQLQDQTIQEATIELKSILEEYFDQEGSHEK